MGGSHTRIVAITRPSTVSLDALHGSDADGGCGLHLHTGHNYLSCASPEPCPSAFSGGTTFLFHRFHFNLYDAFAAHPFTRTISPLQHDHYICGWIIFIILRHNSDHHVRRLPLVDMNARSSTQLLASLLLNPSLFNGQQLWARTSHWRSWAIGIAGNHGKSSIRNVIQRVIICFPFPITDDRLWYLPMWTFADADWVCICFCSVLH